MDENTVLKTSALSAMWGVSERQTRNILSQLEQFGFRLEVSNHGARELPLAVASAVKATRQAGLDLSTLRDREDLQRHLNPKAATDDPLETLVDMRAEVAIIREILGALEQSLSGGSVRYGFSPPQNWGFLAVPSPRRGL